MKDLPSEIRFELPHILSRPVVITNHLLSRLGFNKSPEYKAMLVQMVKNPQSFEKILMEPDGGTKAKMASDIIRRLTTMGVSQTLAREEQ